MAKEYVKKYANYLVFCNFYIGMILFCYFYSTFVEV